MFSGLIMKYAWSPPTSGIIVLNKYEAVPVSWIVDICPELRPSGQHFRKIIMKNFQHGKHNVKTEIIK